MISLLAQRIHRATRYAVTTSFLESNPPPPTGDSLSSSLTRVARHFPCDQEWITIFYLEHYAGERTGLALVETCEKYG